MPRYYCDYCDTYLTHDSPSVRKQHNAGYKHKANVRGYYQQFEEQQTQSLIDQRVKEHLGQTAAFQQVGGAFHQHLSTMQYKPPISIPVLPPPSLPPPGSTPASLTPPSTVRPPVLPRPSGGPPGFGVAPTFRPPVATGTTSRPAAQPNGLPRPTFTPQGAPGVRTVTSSSAASANGPLPAPPHSGPPGVYHQQVPSSGSHGNYTYTAPSVGLSGGFISQRPNITATQTSTPALAATPTPTSTPNPNSIYGSQQASGVAPPPGLANQGSYPYAQGPSRSIQPTANSYGPPPPGAPVLYQT